MGLNPKILALGLVTVGAVVALVVVATGGEEPQRKLERQERTEVVKARESVEAEAEVAKVEPMPGGPRRGEPTTGVAAAETKKPAPRVVAVAPGLKSAPSEAEQQVMSELNASYLAWMKTEENRFAQPEAYALDCRPPVCMLGAKYNSLEDGRFFDRSEKFFRERGELGHLISFPHRLDERHSRAWFFYNPHEPGTAEHHQFNTAAIERIREELKDTPEYYPVPRPGY